MSVTQKSMTLQVEWHVTDVTSQSQEIDLENGQVACIGIQCSSDQQHMLYFITKCRNELSNTCQQISFDVRESTESQKRTEMTLLTWRGPVRVFSHQLTSSLTIPADLTFWVSFPAQATADYTYQLRDRLMATQLWEAAQQKQFTDVEFRLELGETFAAHRAILAARSPVLSAILKDLGDSRSVCGIPRTVRPPVFRDFLRFLYTGQMYCSSPANLSDLRVCGFCFFLKNIC